MKPCWCQLDENQIRILNEYCPSHGSKIKQFPIMQLSWFNRWMASYLIRRGWVCFYLDEEQRVCRNVCWLQLWKEEQERAKKTR